MQKKTYILIAGVLTIVLLVCCIQTPIQTSKKMSLEKRQNIFEKTKMHTEKPVEVLWNSYGVPRISAQNNEDLFYAVGMAQMHLRRLQLEMMRKISLGEVAQTVGPFAKDIDHFLRAIDFKSIAQKHHDSLSQESKQALEAMARGMTDYIEQNPKRPVDMRLLGIKNKAWTALDLATIHKFLSIDVNWMMFARVLGFVKRPYFDKLWSSWVEQKSFLEILKEEMDKQESGAGSSQPLQQPQPQQQQQQRQQPQPEKDLSSTSWAFEALFKNLTKAGSNAFAVAGEKTQSGAAVLSNDPHLGIMIPNIWVFMVLDSPEYKSMGFMIPTFPVPAVGRNLNIAWGGTNMWGVSTVLSEVTPEQLKQASVREEKIKVRFWKDHKVKVREINGQPIISDIPMFAASDKDLALYWVGMEASDEVEAFLKLNRAKNWPEFQQAFTNYAASGQNFLYADKQGNIGKLAAFRQLEVQKPYGFPLKAFVKNKSFRSVQDLPKQYNPKENFVVSANEALEAQGTPLSLFHAPKERVNRMAELLRNKNKVGFLDVRELHLDTFSQSALSLKNTLAEHLKSFHLQNHKVYPVLKNWDGFYREDSQGALVYEVLSAQVMEKFWDFKMAGIEPDAEVSKALYKMYTRSTVWRKELGQFLEQGGMDLKKQQWQKFLDTAEKRLENFKDWGHFHPMTLAHPMSRLPLFGSRFKFYEGPYMGGNETLMKSSHSLSSKKAPVNFGAQARWMTDLSSLDENYFVLLGGQDGWIRTQNTDDQVPLWFDGQYVRVPFGRKAFLNEPETSSWSEQ